MSAEKTPRYRRTKASIEAAIKKAAESQITEHGFANLLVTEIMKAAAIEPPVFYHRYKNLDEFYSVFVKEYDYWFSDLADKAMKNNSDPKAQFIALMRGLLGGVNGKNVMLEILRWEVAEGNDTTKRTAMLREMFTLPLADKYDTLFKESGIDFVALASLLIGGVYYLCLHKERSTFCGIDVKKKDGMDRISKAIMKFTDMMFDGLQRKNEMEEVAKRMRAKGFAEETIKECLGI